MSAATRYALGMAIYSLSIGLQEARRWIESGYIERGKFEIEMAQKEAEEIARLYEEEGKQKEA